MPKVMSATCEDVFHTTSDDPGATGTASTERARFVCVSPDSSPVEKLPRGRFFRRKFRRNQRSARRAAFQKDSFLNVRDWYPNHFPVHFDGSASVRLHLYPSEPLILVGLKTGVEYASITSNIVVQSEGLPQHSGKDIWEIYSKTTQRGAFVAPVLIYKVDPAASYRPTRKSEKYQIGLQFDRWFEFKGDSIPYLTASWLHGKGFDVNEGASIESWSAEVVPHKVYGAYSKDLEVRSWLDQVENLRKKGRIWYDLPDLGDNPLNSLKYLRAWKYSKGTSCTSGDIEFKEETPRAPPVSPEPTWGCAGEWPEVDDRLAGKGKTVEESTQVSDGLEEVVVESEVESEREEPSIEGAVVNCEEAQATAERVRDFVRQVEKSVEYSLSQSALRKEVPDLARRCREPLVTSGNRDRLLGVADNPIDEPVTDNPIDEPVKSNPEEEPIDYTELEARCEAELTRVATEYPPQPYQRLITLLEGQIERFVEAQIKEKSEGQTEEGEKSPSTRSAIEFEEFLDGLSKADDSGCVFDEQSISLESLVQNDLQAKINAEANFIESKAEKSEAVENIESEVEKSEAEEDTPAQQAEPLGAARAREDRNIYSSSEPDEEPGSVSSWDGWDPSFLDYRSMTLEFVRIHKALEALQTRTWKFICIQRRLQKAALRQE